VVSNANYAELAVGWCTFFSGRGVDQCVDLFYETVWSCFERNVPTRYSGCEQKLPKMTREQTHRRIIRLKPRKNLNIAKSGVCRTMQLTTVNEHAYGKNLSHVEKSISISMVEHTMITAQESRR
jgi:hypothetical protein